MIRSRFRTRLSSTTWWCRRYDGGYDVGGGGGGCSRYQRIVTAAIQTTPSRPPYILRARTPTVLEPRAWKTVVGVVARSYHHRACGYLAGLHSHQDASETTKDKTGTQRQADFESFESAWESIQSVPEDLLNDFEHELWETQSRRFVYGTKQVSIIDAVETCKGHDDDEGSFQPPPPLQPDSANNKFNKDGHHQLPTKVFRYLILNERPNLIQTAVEVPQVGAPYRHYSFEEDNTMVPEKLIARPPSPISQTHLGGLAMALPFWYKANGIATNDRTRCTGSTTEFVQKPMNKTPMNDTNPRTPMNPKPPRESEYTPCPITPNCLLIGAGGCSLAHTLAANLFLEEYNQTVASSSDNTANRNEETPQSISRPGLTAVEACPEILRASRLWFGAGEKEEENSESNNRENKDTPEPPFFDLVQTTGETYLESLVELFRKTENGTIGSGNPLPIDILLIDAEDGSAPPQSMRSPEFWNRLVLRSLNLDCFPIVGVNSIGTKSETSELVRVMLEAFGGDKKYTILVVAPPPEAKVTDRHKLVFALPRRATTQTNPAPGAAYWSLDEDDLKGRVDLPEAWKQQIEAALQAVARGEK